MKIAIIALIVLSIPAASVANAVAAESAVFEASWGGARWDWGDGVATDKAGHIYVTGGTVSFGVGSPNSTDALLLKFDASGHMVWVRSWGWTASPGSYNNQGRHVAVDSAGNIYVAGVGATTYAVLLKFDNTGELVWQRVGDFSALADSLAIDPSGNVYVTGRDYLASCIDPPCPEAFLMEVNSSGSLLRYETWDAANLDEGMDVAIDASGNVYMAAKTQNFGTSDDILIVKFSPGGNPLWQKVVSGKNSDYAYGISLDSQSNVYVVGTTASSGAGSEDALVLKFNSSGSLQWQRTWGGHESDWGWSVAADALGNIFVTGSTASFGVGSPNTTDIFLLKLDLVGSLTWAKTLGGPGYDAGSGIALDSSGQIVVSGSIGEAPPYAIGSGNSTLGVPALPVNDVNGTVRFRSVSLLNSGGTVGTPSGDRTYAGGGDLFVFEYGQPRALIVPPLLITLIALVMLGIFKLETRKRPRL